MITRRTKFQLLVFVVITLVGVTFVGARYAKLDQVVRDTNYTVVAHFAESGGIFSGGEVTYRGVGVGQVEKMVLTDEGVDVHLSIENTYDEIPADALAVVGNKSAVGEQYVELQPQTDSGPFLEDDSEIATINTRTPIQTDTILTNLSNTVGSVDRDALETTVNELGDAFAGTGQDLQRIIDTGNSFIETADANFNTTTALIRDANIVLDGQIASESSLRTFANELALFSDSLAGSDDDLRGVIDTGSLAANQLRGFIEDNRIELGSLINSLITTGEVVVKRLDGIRQTLVLFPYIVEAGVTVISKDKQTGLFDAHFGLILTDTMPCTRGYDPAERRGAQQVEERPMDLDARCADAASQSNPRGAQNAPRAGADYSDDSPTITYDRSTGEVTWGDDADSPLASPGSLAPSSLGEEPWKWLYLQPMLGPQG